MSSASLRTWLGPRSIKLDEIEAVHATVGGSARGRRWATEQLEHAYVVLLSSQFQGYCRDLHSECVDCLVRSTPAGPLRAIVRAEFLLARRLDRGNPTASNIGADFSRLGLELWPAVRRLDARIVRRQAKLERLADWRNAIAHQDFDRATLVPGRMRLATIRSWRRTCGALADSFDRVSKRYLGSVTGTSPW